MAQRGILNGSRLTTGVIVLAIHVVFLVLLFLGDTPPAAPVVPPEPAVELVYLPPPVVPRLRAGIPRPIHVTIDVGISLSLLPQPAPFVSAPLSQPDGDGGPGVNWLAEAHRAIEAYEIRRDQHVVHEGLGLSPWGGWLPEAAHYSGEKYRTANGDWVVWINGNCYQIASWHDGKPPAPDQQIAPQTTCVSRENASRRP